MSPDPARAFAPMSYDAKRGRLVLFGGYGSVGILGDTWEWDGTTWTLRSTSGPHARYSHATVYDRTRGVTVLFGGHGKVSPSPLGDTWEWDGNEWALRSTTGPSPRERAALAYDEARQVTILYGGSFSSEHWEWDGSVWTYRGRFPETAGSQWGHAMSFDRSAGVTLLVGLYTQDTWQYDGVTWRPRSTFMPVYAYPEFFGLAFDSARNTTVLSPLRVGNTVPGVTVELPSCPQDTDGDGVPDPYDRCEGYDSRETVGIDGCETGVRNQLLGDGCSMMDHIARCDADARNHGAFVSCVGDLVKNWRDDEVIDPNEKGDIARCAAQAEIPIRPATKVKRMKPDRAQRNRAEADGPAAQPVETLSQP